MGRSEGGGQRGDEVLNKKKYCIPKLN